MRLESRAIDAVTSIDTRRTLDVAFRGGGKYRYVNVPPPVYRALLEAQSAGTFWNEVKDDFGYVKLD